MTKNSTIVSASKDTKWEELVANTVYSWVIVIIPEELWDSVITITTDESHLTVDLATSSHTLQNQPHSFDALLEPRNHSVATKRTSERDQWIATEDREVIALESIHFAGVVDIPLDREMLLLL